MATTTPNIGLTKPIGSENVSRQVINDNYDIIDTEFGKRTPIYSVDYTHMMSILIGEVGVIGERVSNENVQISTIESAKSITINKILNIYVVTSNMLFTVIPHSSSDAVSMEIIRTNEGNIPKTNIGLRIIYT